MKVEDYIGKKVSYDDHGQMIFGEGKDGDTQLIVDVRGWGAIQNMFSTEKEAIAFQDELGQFIADAINEKLKNKVLESHPKYKLAKQYHTFFPNNQDATGETKNWWLDTLMMNTSDFTELVAIGTLEEVKQ